MSAPLIVEQGLPEWVARFAERIQALVRDRPDGPTRLYRVATAASLPDATKWPGCVMYETDLGVVVSNGTAWASITPRLTATATYDPPNLVAGAQDAVQTVAVSGAAMGDAVLVSFSLDLLGLAVRGYVSAAGTVSYVFANPTAGAVNLGSGTVTARVLK